MASRNPFEVLGLSSETVTGLPEKALFELVKVVYRSLLKTYHPDKAGGRPLSANQAREYGRRAVELNLAFEELNLLRNPAAFRRHRKEYAARRPRGRYLKNLALEKDLLRCQAQKEILAENFLAYLKGQNPWLAESQAGFPLRPPADSGGVRLGLTDLAIGRNLKGVPWLLGSNYKEMRLDAQGGLAIKPVGRARFTKAGYIYLLGSVPTASLELWPLLEKETPKEDFFRAPALHAPKGVDGAAPTILNAISPENFKAYCLPLLEPRLLEQAYLFSLRRPDFLERGVLTLEGVVVKISPLKGESGA